MPEIEEIEDSIESPDPPQTSVQSARQPPPPLDSPGELADEPFYADKSPLKASKEDYVKAARGGKVGRPHVNEEGMSNTLLKSDVVSTFPIPRFRIFKNDATNMNQRSKSFYTYWNQLPQWAKDQSILYVYRDWPVFKPLPEDSTDVQYIDKISGSEPLQDDMDLIQRYGAGSYKLMFNEYHSKTAKKYSAENKTANTVASVYVVNLGIGDLKSHPPTDVRINRIENVDLDQPANKSYVEYLRGRGLLPEQGRKAEKESEMAAIQLVDKLTDKMFEMAESKGKDQSGPMQAVVDGALRSNEMLQNSSERQVTMLMDTMTKIQELKDRSTIPGGNGGEESVVKLALELADKIAGNSKQPVIDPMIMEELRELRKQASEDRNARIASLERQLEARANAPAASSPFSSVKEGLTAMRAMKEMVEEMSSGSGKEANPVAEAAAAAGAPAWLMPAIQIGLPIVGQIVQAIMSRNAQAQGGMPMPYPMPGPMQGGVPNPVPMQGPMPPNNVVAMPQVAAAPDPVPPPEAAPAPVQPTPAPPTTSLETYGLPVEVALLLHEVKTPMVQYMNGRVPGSDFADWFVGGYGEPLWKQIAEAGPDELAGAITNFPPIMEKLTALQVGQERIAQFAREFVEWTPEEPIA